MSSNDRALYIGTDDALYRASQNGGWHCDLVGLRGQGGVRGVVVDARDPATLYAATGSGGMWRSRDEGQSWQEINEGIVYKEGWSLSQHPTSGDLYYGTGPSAVYKSTDSGDSWQDLAQLKSLPSTKAWYFPTPPHISHIRQIGLCETDPDRVMAAVEVGWLLRSLDGGQTWENVQEGIWQDAHSVWFMPDNPDVLVATTGNGLYKSTDGGSTFREAKEGLNHVYMTQIVVHPERPRTLFTSGAQVPPHLWRRPEGSQTAFYRSDDQGESWRQLAGAGLPDAFRPASRAVTGDPANPETFIVGMVDGSVWLTEDGGQHFEQAVTNLPGNWVRTLLVTHSPS